LNPKKLVSDDLVFNQWLIDNAGNLGLKIGIYNVKMKEK